MGPIAYDALIVASVRTLEPATAEAIRRCAPDEQLRAFAGTVTHRTPFEAPDAGYVMLDLGRVYHISEVTLRSKR